MSTEKVRIFSYSSTTPGMFASLHPETNAGLLLRNLKHVTIIHQPYYLLCIPIMVFKLHSFTAAQKNVGAASCKPWLRLDGAIHAEFLGGPSAARKRIANVPILEIVVQPLLTLLILSLHVLWGSDLREWNHWAATPCHKQDMR